MGSTEEEQGTAPKDEAPLPPSSSSVAAKAQWLQDAFKNDGSKNSQSKKDLGLGASHIVSDRKKWLEDGAFNQFLKDRGVDSLTASHSNLVEERKRWLDEQAEKNRIENEKNKVATPPVRKTSPSKVAGERDDHDSLECKGDGDNDTCSERNVQVFGKEGPEQDSCNISAEEEKPEEGDAEDPYRDEEGAMVLDENAQVVNNSETKSIGTEFMIENNDTEDQRESEIAGEQREEPISTEQIIKKDESETASVTHTVVVELEEEDDKFALADRIKNAKGAKARLNLNEELDTTIDEEDDDPPLHDPTAKESMPCLFASPIFSEQREQMEFFLPLACSCQKCRQDCPPNADPTALRTILRPWQVEFLESEGIFTASELTCAEQGVKRQHLMKRMKRWRKSRDMPAKSISCLMALRIWSKTAEETLRNAGKPNENTC